MDKSILEEYQRKVEEFKHYLEENRELIQEGITTSIKYTEDKKKEIDAEIVSLSEELKKANEVEENRDADIGITPSGGFILDRMWRGELDKEGHEIPPDYGNDEEGKLLRLYDEARRNPGVAVSDVREISEAIRRERNKKSEAKKADLERRIAEFEGKSKEYLKELEYKSKVSQRMTDGNLEIRQVIADLQEKRKEIAEDIVRQQAIIEREHKKSVEANQSIMRASETMALHKGNEIEIYTVAKKQMEKFKAKAREADRKAINYEKRIEESKHNIIEIESLLDSFNKMCEIINTSMNRHNEKKEQQSSEIAKVEQSEKRAKEDAEEASQEIATSEENKTEQKPNRVRILLSKVKAVIMKFTKRSKQEVIGNCEENTESLSREFRKGYEISEEARNSKVSKIPPTKVVEVEGEKFR